MTTDAITQLINHSHPSRPGPSYDEFVQLLHPFQTHFKFKNF